MVAIRSATLRDSPSARALHRGRGDAEPRGDPQHVPAEVQRRVAALLAEGGDVARE
jgi:hypothetical protein